MKKHTIIIDLGSVFIMFFCFFTYLCNNFVKAGYPRHTVRRELFRFLPVLFSQTT